jgi:uncharacterized protein involved in response to NO
MILFSTGFRPFFLCAGLAAAGLMVVWLLGYTKRDPLLTYYGSSGWHAHEMLFGYSVAVVAGFLLTAVRQWTNSETRGGIPLAGLIVLWLVGRILPLFLSVPPWLVALVDMAFLPVLASILAMPLIRARQRGNILVLILLGVLMIANALIHSEWLGLTAGTARLGEVLAIYTLVLLITMMAGRVIPSFITAAADGVYEYHIGGPPGAERSFFPIGASGGDVRIVGRTGARLAPARLDRFGCYDPPTAVGVTVGLRLGGSRVRVVGGGL